MIEDVDNKFQQFLAIQKEAIDFINRSKSEFKEESSHKELDQVLEILESEYSLYFKKGEERFKHMLITQDKLLQTKKCVQLVSSCYYDNLEMGYKIMDAILAIQNFFDSVLEEKILAVEKKELQQKLEQFLSLYISAINIVKKYINKFKDNNEYKLTIEDLNMGLRNLQRGYDRKSLRQKSIF
jgi:hypothetical protein